MYQQWKGQEGEPKLKMEGWSEEVLSDRGIDIHEGEKLAWDIVNRSNMA